MRVMPVLVVVCAAVAHVSCGTGRDRGLGDGVGADGVRAVAGRGGRPLVPAEPRVFVIPGTELVLPLIHGVGTAPGSDRGGEDDGRGGGFLAEPAPGAVPVLAIDGVGAVRSRLVLIDAGPEESGDRGAVESWLPPTPRWSAQAWDPGVAGSVPPRGSPRAFWALIASIPAEAAGRGVRLDGRALSAVWVEPPPRTEAERAVRLEASVDEWRALGRELLPEALDPLRRWRVRLLEDRVARGVLWGTQGPPPAIADPAIEALAQQTELRWRAALEALRRADAGLAAEVVVGVTAVVRTPAGPLLPAWALDDPALVRLRTTLIDPRSSATSRVEAARDWLDGLVPGVAWVIDEGSGAREQGGDGEPSARVEVGVVNLRASAVSATIAPGDATTPSAPIDLAPMSGASVVVVVPGPRGGALVTPSEVRFGRRRLTLAPVTAALAAGPPGLAMSLSPQWTLE